MLRQIAMQTGPEPTHTEADLIKRVVAWHNRHPLARRLVPSQVRGLGVVVLPFGQPTGRKRPPALFSEDFISPLKTAAIARLAWIHGSKQRPTNNEWPQREIPVDPEAAGGAAEMRYLRTAAIELGSRRIRLLIGDGERPRIMGPRFWSRRRGGWLLSIVTMLALGGVAIERSWPDPGQSGGMVEAPLSSSANAPHQSASAPLPALAAAPLAVETPASAAPAATTELADAASSDDEQPDQIASATPHEPMRAASVGAVPPAAAADDAVPEVRVSAQIAEKHDPAPSVEPQAIPAASTHKQPAAEERAAFALASASTSTLLASQLRIGLMNVPIEPAANRPHAEVMRVGVRWRVVIWPFDSRPAAEALRKSLAEQGMKTELIGF